MKTFIYYRHENAPTYTDNDSTRLEFTVRFSSYYGSIVVQKKCYAD